VQAKKTNNINDMTNEFINILDFAMVLKILIAVAGVVIFILSLRAIIRAKSSKSWNTTSGEIIESKFIEFGSSGDSERIYGAKIKYKYVVQGTEYMSRRIYFGSSLLSNFKRWNGLRYARKFPKGEKVTVYFNRLNSKVSVLEPGIRSEIIFTSAIGIIVFLFGCYLLTNPSGLFT
jgi:hypothetical protein